MKIIFGFFIFCLVLFIYLHIKFHLKSSSDLEMYEIDQCSKDKLEEICDIRQPVLFDFDNQKIMETSNKKYADNLAYEAFVGRFINKQKIRFPCFLETYGLYYNSHHDKKITTFKKMDINKESLIRSCNYPLSIGIMIENIKESQTLDYVITENIYQDTKYVEFMNNDLLYILYQIYYMFLFCYY